MIGDDELKHFGVLGMKWGKHKTESGTSKTTINMAKKDAQRHVDAKMFYGKTAGTKRKLLKAEIERKKKTIPGYEDAFNEHVSKVDTAKSAQKAKRDRVRIDSVDNGRRVVKNVLGITGPLTVAVASALYLRNKERIDSFILSQLNRILH